MKGSTRAAMALSIGYALGRQRKMRTAMLLAAATAVGGKGVGTIALKRGMKMIGSSEAFTKIAPQLTEITDTVRGELVPAGKAAAGAAVTSRVDSLTSSLHERAERLRNPEEAVAAGAEGAKKTAGRAGRAASSAGRAATGVAGVGRRRRRGAAEPEDERDELDARDEEEVDEYEADDLDGDEPEDEYDDEQPADEYDEEEDEEEPDDYDNGDQDEAAEPRRGSARRRSPVSRTRR